MFGFLAKLFGWLTGSKARQVVKTTSKVVDMADDIVMAVTKAQAEAAKQRPTPPPLPLRKPPPNTRYD